MIPREILKKIRQIEIRTNRIVTESAVACARVRIPTGFCPKAQGCEARATLGQRPQNVLNRNAVAAIPFSSAAPGICHNPVGVDFNLNSFTQGSSSPVRLGPTLGWRTQSRWDCLKRAATKSFVEAFNPKTGKLNREIRQTREKGKSISSFWLRSRISCGSRLKICFP
jgi:hypothetical protein